MVASCVVVEVGGVVVVVVVCFVVAVAVADGVDGDDVLLSFMMSCF